MELVVCVLIAVAKLAVVVLMAFAQVMQSARRIKPVLLLKKHVLSSVG
jgi:hypothetical protein